MKIIHAKLLLPLFILLSFDVIAQEIPQLTKEFEITFNQQDVEQSRVIFGINQLNFKSELQARRYFGAISDNLTSFELNFEAKTVTLILQKSNLIEAWNVTEWNIFFTTKKERYSSYYNSL